MIICVLGPTGVGKTKLSVMLAHKYDGIIINADAVQIYKELNIGSAKIKESEKEGVDHYLFDIKSPKEDYSVSDYQNDLRLLLDKYKNRNIILVGGTGLYVAAGLYDYNFCKMVKKNYDDYSNEELYEMCLKKNKDLSIDKNNRRRLENYLNREEEASSNPRILYKDVYFIGLTTNRDNLYERINKRVDEMFDEGLVNEVESLYKKYGNTRILGSAIGYKEIIKYINKEISLEEAKEEIKKNSRHYAKRQYTWFNNKMSVKWFNTDFNNFNNTYNEVVEYINKK